MLREYDRKVMELISVDDFDPHELAAQSEPAARAEPDAHAAAARADVA
jgi:hypothetical protein